jgi:hypothetical protein
LPLYSLSGYRDSAIPGYRSVHTLLSSPRRYPGEQVSSIDSGLYPGSFFVTNISNLRDKILEKIALFPRFSFSYSLSKTIKFCEQNWRSKKTVLFAKNTAIFFYLNTLLYFCTENQKMKGKEL